MLTAGFSESFVCSKIFLGKVQKWMFNRLYIVWLYSLQQEH